MAGFGENVRIVLPFGPAISLKTIDMKLILLSTQDNSLGIFFEPWTGEFYTITVEPEDEDDTQDETLLDSVSRLAHSVCAKDLLGLEVSDRNSQRLNSHNSSPAHPSISTAGNYVCLNSHDFEE